MKSSVRDRPSRNVWSRFVRWFFNVSPDGALIRVAPPVPRRARGSRRERTSRRNTSASAQPAAARSSPRTDEGQVDERTRQALLPAQAACSRTCALVASGAARELLFDRQRRRRSRRAASPGRASTARPPAAVDCRSAAAAHALRARWRRRRQLSCPRGRRAGRRVPVIIAAGIGPGSASPRGRSRVTGR